MAEPTRFSPQLLLPVVANILPILGVIFWGWKPLDAFIIYALETLIIGIMTVIKLLITAIHQSRDVPENTNKKGIIAGLFMIVFFIFHFGMFAAIQTSIFTSVSGLTKGTQGPLYFFLNWYKFVTPETVYALYMFIVSYAVTYLVPFMYHQEYKSQGMAQQMMEPYGRIFVQQFTVIIGSIFLMFNWGIGFLIVFVGIKIYAEFYFQNKLSEKIKLLSEKNDLAG